VLTLIKWRKKKNRRIEKAAAAVDTVDMQSMKNEIEKSRDAAERLREERNRLRRGIAHLIGIKVPDEDCGVTSGARRNVPSQSRPGAGR